MVLYFCADQKVIGRMLVQIYWTIRPNGRHPDIRLSDCFNEFKEILEQVYYVQCKFIKFSSLMRMKKHCVLWVTPLMWLESGSHVVMFDAIKRRILDPAGVLKNLDEYNVACCLEID